MEQLYASWLSDAGYGEITRIEALSGGCINNTARLQLDSGLSVVLKVNNSAPADFFHAEAAGLAALSQRQAVRVPAVLQVSDRYLILEDLGSASPGRDYWPLLGAGLAALHREPAEVFGFTQDNYCGATIQSNAIVSNGHQFFAEQRIMALALQCLAFWRVLTVFLAQDRQPGLRVGQLLVEQFFRDAPLLGIRHQHGFELTFLFLHLGFVNESAQLHQSFEIVDLELQ